MPPKHSRAEVKRQAPAPKAEAKSEKSQAELREALEKKLIASKPRMEEAIKEYERALANNTFDDAPGEAVGTGNKRKEAMEKRWLGMVERAKKMRRQLDSGDDIPQAPDEEELTQATTPFMLDTFQNAWGWDITDLTPEGHVTAPQAQSYEALLKDTDPTKRGAYTLNPETQGLNFEHLKPFIPDLSQFEAQAGPPSKPAAKLHEVFQYVVDTYGDKYYVPGIEYWKWLIENPTKDPPDLTKKANQYYFFPGSVLRDGGGGWRVPCADWDGSEWFRNRDWLAGDWGSDCRVVLLEKEP